MENNDTGVWILVDFADGRYGTRQVSEGTRGAVYLRPHIWRAFLAHLDLDQVFQDMLRRIDNSLYNGGDGH